MATKASIIAEITSKVITPNLWRIGLTHDIAERKKYWGETKGENIKYWQDWKCDSLSDAQDIEAHFINKGCKGGVGGDLSRNKTVYVYVF